MKNECYKKVFTIIGTIAAVLLFSFLPAKAKADTNGGPHPTPTIPPLPDGAAIMKWDLVDNGRHSDWTNSSRYTPSIEKGAATWNGVHDVFRKKGLFAVRDIEISETFKILDNGEVLANAIAVTRSDGKIIFSTYHMEQLGTSEKHHVALHELGHALGLADRYETYLSETVMYGYCNTVNNLSQLEIDTFNWLYDNRYR